MPHARPLAALLAAAAAFAFAGPPVAAQADRPHVLFIAVDDLRPQINSFGVERMHTPNLDRLAARGVRFDRAYCNIAVCGASRASLMSGLRPTPTRFTSYQTWVQRDAPGVPTLATTFKRAGYHTVTNGKVYHNRGDDAEAWSEPDWRPAKGGTWWALKQNRDLMTGPRNRGPAYESADAPDDEYPDHDTASKTIEDLRRLAKGDKPFFVACGFHKPHLPFVAPKRYWDLYGAEAITPPGNMYLPRGLPQAFNYTWGEMRSYHGIPPSGPVSDEQARELIHGYQACVSFADAQVGRLLDEVDRLGIADRTIIVLWGDHGWQLGEHGFWCKHTNFEVATRVPLIIVAPGVAGGRASTRLVETIDLYPTLCDLAGLEKPDHLHGKSLRPLLDDADAPHKDAVFTRHGGGDAVRTDRYRYMEVRAGGGRGELRGVGLFDLENDPHENRNVADDPAFADELKRLRGLLDAVRAGNGP
jgi:arylsulfatase A-like enzyme